MFYTWKRENECFYIFSPFSAYISPHYIVVEKGLLSVKLVSAGKCCSWSADLRISVTRHLSCGYTTSALYVIIYCRWLDYNFAERLTRQTSITFSTTLTHLEYTAVLRSLDTRQSSPTNTWKLSQTTDWRLGHPFSGFLRFFFCTLHRIIRTAITYHPVLFLNYILGRDWIGYVTRARATAVQYGFRQSGHRSRFTDTRSHQVRITGLISVTVRMGCPKLQFQTPYLIHSLCSCSCPAHSQAYGGPYRLLSPSGTIVNSVFAAAPPTPVGAEMGHYRGFASKGLPL